MMKGSLRKLSILTILIICIFTSSFSVHAATATRPRCTWVASAGGHMYYYNSKRTLFTGLHNIGNYQYFFDTKHRQLTGWLNVKGSYYFFYQKPGKNGYMAKSTKINGITLSKNGKAVVTSANRRKLRLLVAANTVVESITNDKMSSRTKLLKCFNYTKNTYQYRSYRNFVNKPGWELDFAEDMLINGGRGDCFSYAAAFGYLANAVGYRNVKIISSGGHGWAEINNRVYDPDWALVSRVDSYFDMSYSLSGVAGRPNYRSARAYVVTI